MPQDPPHFALPESVKVRCPHCQSRLDVLETASGGRTVSASTLGPTLEVTADALELFIPPSGATDLQCPACSRRFDPAGPYPIPPSRRTSRLTDAAMEVCSTDVVLAPAERVWHLLTDPRKLAQWTGLKVFKGPACPMKAGDHLVLGAMGLRLAFDVLDMRSPRELALDVRLFFGVRNHEHIQITPIDAHSSRVTFNAHFIFPPGWRGQLLEKILRRRFVTGPARSLRRLKHAAEQDPILA